MEPRPDSLGELLANCEWLAAEWSGALVETGRDEVGAMSDDGLMRVTMALAKIRREVELLEVKCASAIHERSSTEVRSEGLAGRLGFSSPQRLIASTTGAAAGDATKLIEVARATEPRERFGEAMPPRFPVVAESVAAGTLSVDAAHSITRFLGRVAPGVEPERMRWAEGALVERVTAVGVDGLGHYQRLVEAQLDPERVVRAEAQLRADRELRVWQDASGMVNLRGRFDPINGAMVKTAIDALVGAALHDSRDDNAEARLRSARAADGDGDTAEHAGGVPALAGGSGGGSAAFRGDGSASARSVGDAADLALADTRTLAQMSADALADIARLALSSDEAPPSLAAATVVARIDLDELVSGIGFAELDGIEMPISAATARELAAAADVIPAVLGGRGELLDLGRRQRRFTRAQRIALAERDGGCAHPGCDRPPAYTQAHHIKWWNRHHGPTDLDNGVLLCSFHHHLVHDTGWGIFVRDHRVWFVPPAALDPEQRPRPGRQAKRRELASMPAA